MVRGSSAVSGKRRFTGRDGLYGIGHATGMAGAEGAVVIVFMCSWL